MTKNDRSKGDIIKTIIIGAPAVGKTQLKRRYLGQKFSEGYEMTDGSELSVKRIDPGVLQIWDLSSHPGHKAVNKKFLKETQGVFLVFDVNKPKSLTELKVLMKELVQQNSSQIPCIIVGNKVDLRKTRGIKKVRENALKYSRELTKSSIHDVPYIETSAKTGLNIDYIFDFIIDEIISTNKL
ncbi:MAG: Rab family GTPase [Candidatus Kariarchaeaceae archaeon]